MLIDWNIAFLYNKLIPDVEERRYFLRHVVTPEWHFQHDAGALLADTTAQRIKEFPHYADLIRLYEPRWLETIGDPLPGMFELIWTLHEQHMPLFAITNFSAELWPRFAAATPVTRCFRDVVVSGAEKIMKPDPRIYTIAHARFGTQPGQAVFIDDRLENVLSAEAAGFIGHHFNGVDGVIARLASLGIV